MTNYKPLLDYLEENYLEQYLEDYQDDGFTREDYDKPYITDKERVKWLVEYATDYEGVTNILLHMASKLKH